MPLFMDYHKFDTITIEDVKNAHMADVAVQEKYGVKYHQFWVNQEAGTVFCLVEGPDKESCEAVHRTAHGNLACAIVEVEAGFYELFMGKSVSIDTHGLVINRDGTQDPGYRNVMVVSLHPANVHSLEALRDVRRLISAKTAEFHGRKVDWAADDNLVSVFDSASQAVRCAREIQKAADRSIVARIGITAAQPVTEKSSFFGDAIRLACRLTSLAGNNQILLSSLAGRLYEKEEGDGSVEGDIAVLNQHDEQFIMSLFSVIEEKLSHEDFTLDSLSKEIGVSRPQLYRKIVTLSGKAPNDLVRDLRMNKALSLLKGRSLNISQIAMEVGYNNPSYFSRCFAERYGCAPSEFEAAAGF